GGWGLFQKCARIVGGVFETHADEFRLAAKLAIAPVQHRMLDFAGPAPGRPKVDHHRTPLELGERYFPAAVQLLQRKRRRWLSGEHERNLVRILAEALRQNHDQGRANRGRQQNTPPPAHAVSRRLLELAAAPTAGAKARRDCRCGQIAISAPATRIGMLHQIHPTSGNTQAFKVALWRSSDSAISERYRSPNAVDFTAGVPIGSVLRSKKFIRGR